MRADRGRAVSPPASIARVRVLVARDGRRGQVRFGASRGPGARRRRPVKPQAAPPLPPLGNGEPVSWTFQPYPGGTGALMEKMVHEHGAAAFQRSVFYVAAVDGHRADLARRDRVPSRRIASPR